MLTLHHIVKGFNFSTIFFKFTRISRIVTKNDLFSTKTTHKVSQKQEHKYKSAITN